MWDITISLREFLGSLVYQFLCRYIQIRVAVVETNLRVYWDSMTTETRVTWYLFLGTWQLAYPACSSSLLLEIIQFNCSASYSQSLLHLPYYCFHAPHTIHTHYPHCACSLTLIYHQYLITPTAVSNIFEPLTHHINSLSLSSCLMHFSHSVRMIEKNVVIYSIWIYDKASCTQFTYIGSCCLPLLPRTLQCKNNEDV